MHDHSWKDEHDFEVARKELKQLFTDYSNVTARGCQTHDVFVTASYRGQWINRQGTGKTYVEALREIKPKVLQDMRDIDAYLESRGQPKKAKICHMHFLPVGHDRHIGKRTIAPYSLTYRNPWAGDY